MTTINTYISRGSCASIAAQPVSVETVNRPLDQLIVDDFSIEAVNNSIGPELNRSFNILSNDEIAIIGNFLGSPADIHSFESTAKKIKLLASQNLFPTPKLVPINKQIQSIEQLQRIIPICNSLNEQGYKIHMHINVDQGLIQGVIPENVTQITFGNNFNQPLEPGMLPENLQHLSLGRSYNQTLVQGMLPENLQQITFGSLFNQPLLPGIFPEGLLKVTFGICFNQPIPEGVLPQTVRQLELGILFNQDLSPNAIPRGLQHISVGQNYRPIFASGAIPEGCILTRRTHS